MPLLSRVRFRPALIPTVFAISGLAVLLGLGSWQLARLEWKTALIAEFESRAHSQPLPLASIANSNPPRFQRITAQGSWLHDKEVHLTGRVFEGNAGYHIITPFQLNDGRIVLVNRGWVPEALREADTRRHTLIQTTTLEAIIRAPQPKPWLVPDNMPESRDWFTLNIADIRQYHRLGGTLITSFTLDAIRHGRGLPIGSGIDTNLRNAHLQYALTWYGLAAALLGVYLAWHIQQGRLGWR